MFMGHVYKDELGYVFVYINVILCVYHSGLIDPLKLLLAMYFS